MTQVRPMRPGTLLGLLGRGTHFVGYYVSTRGSSLPGQEAIIEEENEANLPAFAGPLDPAIPQASYLWIPVPQANKFSCCLS